MIDPIKISKVNGHEYVLNDNTHNDPIALIIYSRGIWLLKIQNVFCYLYVNEKLIQESKPLQKYDIIRVGKQKFYWSNYLYEGERQTLGLRDFTSFNGRISKSNFRALSLLAFGLAICIFFLPGVLIAVWEYLNRKRYSRVDFDTVCAIELIAPYVYTIGFSLLLVIFILVSLKRLRDTGNSPWKLLLPFYNLKILFFNDSVK